MNSRTFFIFLLVLLSAVLMVFLGFVAVDFAFNLGMQK